MDDFASAACLDIPERFVGNRQACFALAINCIYALCLLKELINQCSNVADNGQSVCWADNQQTHQYGKILQEIATALPRAAPPKPLTATEPQKEMKSIFQLVVPK